MGGFLSLVFSLSGGLWCRLVQITVTKEYSNTGLPNKNLGLWKQQNLDFAGTIFNNRTRSVDVVVTWDCVNYSSRFFRDQFWKSSMGLQMATYVLASALSLLLLATLCGLRLSVTSMRIVGILFICGCSLFQGLIFLVLKSNLCSLHSASDGTSFDLMQGGGVYETHCVIGRGGVLVCIAVVGYFLTGLACLRLTLTKKSAGSGGSASPPPA